MGDIDKKKIILVGAGKIGEEALSFFGIKNVYCFADTYHYDWIHCGNYVISFEELRKIHRDYDVVLSIGYSQFSDLSNQLNEAQIPYTAYSTILKKHRQDLYENQKIAAFKNIHQNESCFLVGNGPSLLPSDLDSIQKHGYATIACNFINKIFDKTDWRPDYYCCEESSAILLNKDFIMNYPLKAKFIKNFKNRDDAELFFGAREDVNFFVYCASRLEVSENIAKIIYDGYTVMFPMLQIAMYMGFSKIYLIGVDNTQPPGPHTKNFAEVHSHFYDEDVGELEKRREILPAFGFDDDWNHYFTHVNSHYQVARDYAEEHGIKIYNATRGGKLEVFERVDIDELLGEQV